MSDESSNSSRNEDYVENGENDEELDLDMELDEDDPELMELLQRKKELVSDFYLKLLDFSLKRLREFSGKDMNSCFLKLFFEIKIARNKKSTKRSRNLKFQLAMVDKDELSGSSSEDEEEEEEEENDDDEENESDRNESRYEEISEDSDNNDEEPRIETPCKKRPK